MLVDTNRGKEVSTKRLKYINEQTRKCKSAKELLGRIEAQKRIDALLADYKLSA